MKEVNRIVIQATLAIIATMCFCISAVCFVGRFTPPLTIWEGWLITFYSFYASRRFRIYCNRRDRIQCGCYENSK